MAIVVRMENMTKIAVPIDVIADICYYLSPDVLHALASYSKQARYIINGGGGMGYGVNRARYIERWLDTTRYGVKYMYALTEDNMVYEVENYWYYKLTMSYYVNNKPYIMLLKILKKVKNKSLYIRLRRVYTAIFDMEVFADIHTLDLNDAYIKDVTALANVHTLYLTECEYITDVSMLGNVHTLCLMETHIEDVSELGSVYNLNLINCKYIKDINMLGNIYKLDLPSKIFDKSFEEMATAGIDPITELYYVNKLNAELCKYITDCNIWKLANVNDLGISHCYNITNVGFGALGNVKKIYLSGCYIENPGMLGSAHTLDLSGTNVNNVDALGGVEYLDLTDCQEIADIRALASVPELDVSECENIVKYK